MILSLLSYFRRQQEKKTLYRNFIFGVEDALVSTVGLLSGVAAASATRETIITSGIVLIFVEAFSMAIGSYLSEETTEKGRRGRTLASHAASVMFVSYLVAGCVPLIPYLITPVSVAYPLSIVVALTALVALGIHSAIRFTLPIMGKAVEMVILGGLATLVGVAIGSLLKA